MLTPMDLYNLRGTVRSIKFIEVFDNQWNNVIPDAILIYSSGESGFAMDIHQNIYTFICLFNGNDDDISSIKDPTNYSISVNEIVPFTLGELGEKFDDSKTPYNYITGMGGIQGTHSIHQHCFIYEIHSFDPPLIGDFVTVETISNYYYDGEDSWLFGMNNAIQAIQQYLFYDDGVIYCRHSIDKNTWSSWLPILKNDGTLYEKFSANYKTNGSITTDWGSINYLYRQKNRFLSTLKLKVNIEYAKAYSSLSYGTTVPLFNLVNYFDTTGAKSEPNIIAFLKYLLKSDLLPQSSAAAVNEDGKGNLVKVGLLGSDVGTDDKNTSVPNYGELMLSPLIIGNGTSLLKNQASKGCYEHSNSSFAIVLTADGFDSTIAK